MGSCIGYYLATPRLAERGMSASIYKHKRFPDHSPLNFHYAD